MKLEHAKLLREFHMKCEYRYTYPIQWEERLLQIDNLIKSLQEQITATENITTTLAGHTPLTLDY